MLVVQDFVYHAAGPAQEAVQVAKDVVGVAEVAAGAAVGAVVKLVAGVAAVDVKAAPQDVRLGVQRRVLLPAITAASINVHKAAQVVAQERVGMLAAEFVQAPTTKIRRKEKCKLMNVRQ